MEQWGRVYIIDMCTNVQSNRSRVPNYLHGLHCRDAALYLGRERGRLKL